MGGNGQESFAVDVSAWLDNAEVCREAIDLAGDLPHADETEFERFHTYLLVDEPIIQLMPGYLLPVWAEQGARPQTLHALAVAAKLENARNRWLDNMVDNHEDSASSMASHGLNTAIAASTHRLYSTVVPNDLAGKFFERLATLYARHALSLAVDGKRKLSRQRFGTLVDYEVQAKARHSSVRAPLDALLTLLRTDDGQFTTATDSWHAWGLGAQLYDDALDVEEDFRLGTMTWTVSRTLECFGGRVPDNPDEFYGVALKEGVVTQTLERAQAHFARAAELAGSAFPRWVPVQDGWKRQVRALREDYESLLTWEPFNH